MGLKSNSVKGSSNVSIDFKKIDTAMSLENQINCPECNKLNPYDAKFCGFCGMNLVEVMDTDLLLLQTELEPKHYKIKKRLGQGGMASVYLAEQIKLERLVAVKILSKELSENKEMRERFLSEARTEAKIKHYAIVEIFDVGVVEGRPYFIMEYGESGSLSELLEKNQNGIPLKDVVFYISKILQGLSVAHSKGVIHRDIKPDNILIRENGDPFIVDFGIAKNLFSSMKTQTGQLIGTVNYMSPEQCIGASDIDERADFYSVGIMFYQLLTGEIPFKGESPITIINKHISDDIPLLDKFQLPETSYNSEKRERINSIIRKACHKEKTARYNSAKEMIEELKSLNINDNFSLNSNPNSKKIKILIFSSITLCFIFLFSFLFLKYSGEFINDEEPQLKLTEHSPWTNNLGKMDWENAIEICEKYKLRLPDIDELNSAYNSGITTTWVMDGNDYWSISTKNETQAFYMNIYFGFKYSSNKSNEFFVRCYNEKQK